MNGNDGTFAKLMEMSETPAPPPPSRPKVVKPIPPIETPAVRPPVPAEDLGETPYISQNYRFTEEELRWLRTRAFELSEQVGTKVSQNTILRIALRELRDACDRNPNTNPLSKAVTRLKK